MSLIEFPVHNDKYVTRTPIKQLIYIIHHYKRGVNTCHITYETTITHFTAHMEVELGSDIALSVSVNNTNVWDRTWFWTCR